MERDYTVYKYTVMAVLTNGTAVKTTIRENYAKSPMVLMKELKEKDYIWALDSYDNAIVVDTKHITYIEVLKKEVE